MAASWSCLKCQRPIPGGMPSFLVTAGYFFVAKGTRSFKVEHDAHEALCAGCVDAIKAEGAPSLAGGLGPEPACEECHEVIEEGKTVYCEECFREADERVLALAAGSEVAV